MGLDYKVQSGDGKALDVKLTVDPMVTEKETANQGLFESAYESTAGFVKEHPVASAAIAATAIGTIAYLTRGKGAAVAEMVNGGRGASMAGAELRTTMAAESAELRAAAQTIKTPGGRLTVEGKEIPVVSRPAMEQAALTDVAFAGQIEKARNGYASDLIKFWQQPASTVGAAGETGATLAERLVQSRAAITSERVTADVVGKEVARLGQLNPGLIAESNVAGQTIQVWNREHLTAMSSEALVFKHVPPIGQYLKGTGRITEVEIGKALEIQKTMPQKRIGEILVENRLATQADVDLAFARQAQTKDVLKELREKFWSTLPH